jgi:hypothetical protein
MSWGPDLRSEIAALFRPLGACISRSWLNGVLIDEGSRLNALQERERVDPEWRAHVAAGREARRRERMALDPEYRESARAQRRAAKARWRAEHGVEAERALWRESKRRAAERRRSSLEIDIQPLATPNKPNARSGSR